MGALKTLDFRLAKVHRATPMKAVRHGDGPPVGVLRRSLAIGMSGTSSELWKCFNDRLVLFWLSDGCSGERDA